MCFPHYFFIHLGGYNMLQVYSNGLSVEPGNSYSLNNVTFLKGCTAGQTAPATLIFNKKGVYLIEVDAYGSATAAGTYGVQVAVNGTPRLDAISMATIPAVGDLAAVSTKAIVVVPQDNCPCNCYSAPTTVQIINPVEATATTDDTHINVVVTKLC